MRNRGVGGVEHIATFVAEIGLRNVKQQTSVCITPIGCSELKMRQCVVTFLTWGLKFCVPVQRYKREGRAGLRQRVAEILCVQNYIRGISNFESSDDDNNKSNSSSTC